MHHKTPGGISTDPAFFVYISFNWHLTGAACRKAFAWLRQTVAERPAVAY
jgi:hypothetical protein